MAAMDQTLAEIIQTDIIRCKVCSQSLKNAKLLPCLDTICHKCLNNFISQHPKGSKNGSKALYFRCPLCEEETKFPNGVKGLMELKTNYFLHSLNELAECKSGDPKPCDYCAFDGKRTVASNRCLDCQDNMCEGCTDAHKKTKVTRNHRIAPFKEIQNHRYDHDLREAQQIGCQIHDGQLLSLFCENCKQLICPKCKVKHHDDHTWLDLKPASEKISKQLEALKASIKGKIPDMKNYLRNLGDYMNFLNHQEKSIVESVQLHSDMLHKMIDKNKVELIDCVQNGTKAEMASVEQKLKGMNHTLRGLSGNAEFLDIIMKHGKHDEVLFLYKQIADRLSRLLYIQTNPLQKKLAINFLPGTATEQNIELLFGRIHTAMRTVDKDGSIPNGPSKELLHIQSMLPALTKVEQLMHFDASCDHDIKDIWPTGLAITDSGDYVIVDRGNKRVKIYNREGNFRTSISGHGRYALDSPYDVTIMKNGNIAVTDYGKEDVKIFTADCKFHNVVSGPFKHPRGIAINSKGHMIILDCGRQQITIHDEDGTLKDTIKGKDEEGVEYFTDPYYVSVMQNDNIIVTDWAAPNIKVFSATGECLASSGTYGIKQDQLLQPYGVCTDEFGYIFIADNQNNRIHLLLPDGRFFKFLLTKIDGLWHPMAVAINNQGQLVVTEGLGKVKVFKYI